MKTLFKHPEWIDQFEYSFTQVDDIPDAFYNTVNQDLDRIQYGAPAVSVVICAWNEEVNILKTIASLSKTKADYPIEIIVVNNNSTDRTQEILDKLHVKTVFQPIQGWGPARQMGLEKSRGKYVLLADADCIYPDCWVASLVKELQQRDVVCVLGKYSFISEQGFPRWKLFMLERMKDVITEIRHYKRPYLNAYGMSMGFVRAYGLEIGFVMHKIRGEDGRLCYDLMKFGKTRLIRNDEARVWTKPRALQRDGSFSKSLWLRLSREVSRLHTLLKPLPEHDTKTSTND
jgi:glycosyltransferase involved in cell wall biosynthesis